MTILSQYIDSARIAIQTGYYDQPHRCQRAGRVRATAYPSAR